MARLVKRKWGYYLTLVDRPQFKVKLLRFSKGKQMSMQYHSERNELWLFLNGEHGGTYRHIPMRQLHTYNAPKPTYVIEVQYGNRCDESDIVRIT